MKRTVRDLRAAVEVIGLTPADIARETGLSRQYVYEVMCGRRKGKRVRDYVEQIVTAGGMRQIRDVCTQVEGVA